MKLNQNKNSKQPCWPDSVWTLFYLRNKSHTSQLFTRILQNGCSKKTWEKGAELVSAYEKLFWKKYGSKS